MCTVIWSILSWFTVLSSPPLPLSRWADKNLGETGLSDTAELLDELMREGYLSPTDLDMSTSQTAHHSRYSAYKTESYSKDCLNKSDYL